MLAIPCIYRESCYSISKYFFYENKIRCYMYIVRNNFSFGTGKVEVNVGMGAFFNGCFWTVFRALLRKALSRFSLFLSGYKHNIHTLSR